MRISFANMVAALSEQLPGGDVDTVTGALGFDTRIGSRYLKGAVAYGGPCFPRDNQALAYLARQLGQKASLAEAVHAFNESTNQRLAERVLELVGRLVRSEEHTSELQSRFDLVCRLLLEKKKKKKKKK